MNALMVMVGAGKGPVVEGGDSVVDPSALPEATGQTRETGTYGASLAAGATYADETTGTLCMKITSATVPAANSGVYGGYSEGGPIISRPWTGGDGDTYYTVVFGDDSLGWLVDINYTDKTAGNYRSIPNNQELEWTFSLIDGEERILYYNDGDDVIQRYNCETDEIENTGPFPWEPTATGSALSWLQTNPAGWLLGMYNSNQTVVAIRVSDEFERSITAGANDVDEPHLDREFAFVYIATNNLAHWVVNLVTGATVSESGTDTDAADHSSPGRGYATAYHFEEGMVQVTKEGVRSVPVTEIVIPPGASGHTCHQWMDDNDDRYVAISNDDDATAGYNIREHMIGMVSLDTGDVRLIVCGDNEGQDYFTGGQMHPGWSPDGKILRWTTNHGNATGRYDIHLAFLPVT